MLKIITVMVRFKFFFFSVWQSGVSRDLAELLEGCVKVFFFVFFFFTLGKQPHQQNVSPIDAGLSQAVMDSSRLNDQNGNVAETTITAEKSLFPQAKSTDLRP